MKFQRASPHSLLDLVWFAHPCEDCLKQTFSSVLFSPVSSEMGTNASDSNMWETPSHQFSISSESMGNILLLRDHSAAWGSRDCWGVAKEICVELGWQTSFSEGSSLFFDDLSIGRRCALKNRFNIDWKHEIRSKSKIFHLKINVFFFGSVAPIKKAKKCFLVVSFWT